MNKPQDCRESRLEFLNNQDVYNFIFMFNGLKIYILIIRLVNTILRGNRMNFYCEFIHPQSSESDPIELPSLSLNPPLQNERKQPPKFRSYSRKDGIKSRKAKYNWNSVQNKKYINFLVKRRELFDLNNEQRKCMKINVIMSSAIPTRTAAQCHSHHQKMVLKYGGTIQGVIKAHRHLLQTKYISKRSLAFITEIFCENKKEEQQIELNLISEEQKGDRESSPSIFGMTESRFGYDEAFIDFNI